MFVVAALTGLGLLLRIARLDFQPLWWDEGYSVWFAHHPLAEMVRLTALDIHPPLYYALLGAWSRTFGWGPIALRLLSVAIGVLAVPVAYVVAKWLAGRRAGLIAAFLLAINSFHIYYSQEVRMYGLVMLWSLLAVGLAWRSVEGGEEKVQRTEWRWLAGYGVVMTLALYTQYYAGFLAVGLAIAGLVELWRQRRGRQATIWLGVQAVVAALVMPWVLYAGPKLVSYVSQKVVADSDKPLGLITYLARHMSAYTAGHMEGPLAPWWPLGLLGAAALGWGLWRLLARRSALRDIRPDQTRTVKDQASPFQAIRFLSIALVTVLLLGWLVNLTFPFFPDRGERLLLLGLPLFILLVATVIADLWTSTIKRNTLLLIPFLALAALSLAAFYVIPRYPGEDYRPLIGQVEQWGRPKDRVLAVYPWQVGYFWSYGSPDGPQPLLSPADDWTPALSSALDAALAQGHLWFPEHLSLGGLLETKIEAMLGQESALLANRWYSPSTRLTGWASPQETGQDAQNTAMLDGPYEFAGRSLAKAILRPTAVEAANQAILVDLAWTAAETGDRHVALRLVGPDGRTWALQDLTLAGPASTDRLGLLAPAGTPPGDYRLQLSLAEEAGGLPLPVTGPGLAPGVTSLDLGQVVISVPHTAPPLRTLPIEQPLDVTLENALHLVGASATAGPIQPGEDLAVSLFWQALPGLHNAAPADLFMVLQLLDDKGQVVAGWEGPPVGWHSTQEWQAGELVRSQQTLRLPATVPDGRYRLVTGVFDPTSGQRLSGTWKAGPGGVLPQRGVTVPLSTVDVVGREHVMTAPEPQTVLQAELARVGRLEGFDLDATQAAPGDTLDLTLYWQAQESTGDRLRVFVHLLDAQGAIIGQSDGEPAGGAAPTSGWLPGETIADQRTIAIRSDARAGPATLVVGLYDPITGGRVPWLDALGQPAGDALALPQPISVQAR